MVRRLHRMSQNIRRRQQSISTMQLLHKKACRLAGLVLPSLSVSSDTLLSIFQATVQLLLLLLDL